MGSTTGEIESQVRFQVITASSMETMFYETTRHNIPKDSHIRVLRFKIVAKCLPFYNIFIT
jgi:hypothetical protein